MNALRVDGGACANDLLMQFQSDILQTDVQRPKVIETTALGAAYLAGIAVGFYEKKQISKNWAIDRTFKSSMSSAESKKLYKGWQKAVERTMKWENA